VVAESGTLIDILSLPPPPFDSRVAYGSDPAQFGQLRLPGGAGGEQWPVVCVVHGGYYRARYDLAHIGHLAQALTQAGIATWTIEYRRLGQAGGGWPGTFTDVGMALDALRQVASVYPLDLSRVIALGHSAGGQLALWLASRGRQAAGSVLSVAEPLSLVGVVALAPVADLVRASQLKLSDGVVDQLMGGAPDEVPQRYALASPLSRLPLGVAQVVIHGTADTAVPAELGERYVSAAQAAGDPAELELLAGVDHFDIIDPRTSAFSATRAAVLRLLGLSERNPFVSDAPS
jgi:acetyl esterase/lipase